MTQHDPAAVRLIVLDVDGCLTDGSIFLDDDGREIKRFNIKDGLGLAAWQQLGGHAAIITGRTSGSLAARARELGITRVYQGVRDKGAALAQLLDDLGLSPEQTAAVGDDWNDLPMLSRVGFPACPADASDAVKQRAAFIASRPGGHGAVRELIEHLLSAQGRMDQALALYLPNHAR
ncbi:MAG: KdsC family phosphatase [Phycisphaerales bacterium]